MGPFDWQGGEERHGQGKGKGKAPVVSETLPDAHTHLESAALPESSAKSADVSITSRVTKSAVALVTSLTSDVIDPSGAQKLFSTRKESGSSSSFRGSQGETSAYRSIRAGDPTDATYRSPQAQADIQHQEAAFSAFLDDTGAPGLADAYVFDSVEQGGRNAPFLEAISDGSPAVPEADGMEVVKLLQEAYPETDTPEPEMPVSGEAMRVLRAALFREDSDTKGQTLQAEWEGVLNFIPDYVSNGNAVGNQNELAQHLGITDPYQARDVWIEQWKDVLASYTDEVWGDLNSLVDEARGELDALNTNRSRPIPATEITAILRLRQILGHVRGR